MKDFNIRIATSKDTEILISFQQRMALDTEGLVLDKGILSRGVQALLSDKNKGTYYVAEYEGKIIGCLLTTPEWSEWRNGTVLWIQSVFVIEEYRKKGVFKSLYNFIKQKVENENALVGIRLYVDKTNLNAQEVYTKIGMDGQHYQLFEWMK